jgi:hypothetical protein
MEQYEAKWIQDPRAEGMSHAEKVRVWHVQDFDAPTYLRTLCGKQIHRSWTNLRKSRPRTLKKTMFIDERICLECENASLPI